MQYIDLGYFFGNKIFRRKINILPHFISSDPDPHTVQNGPDIHRCAATVRYANVKQDQKKRVMMQ
jgi:hypothetical protein